MSVPLMVVGMCKKCHRGFVQFRRGARCHACQSRIIPIEPVPNEPPHTNGPYVVNGKLPELLP